MSISRQNESQVRSYSITHPPGRVSLPTQPGWDYFVFAQAGLFTALTEAKAWVVPTHRVLCVPDGTLLRIETAKRVSIKCLYIDKGLEILAGGMRVVNVMPLTRELMLHAVASAPMNLELPANSATITLLADRLANEPDAPLHLPLPTDPVATEVAAAIRLDPAVELAEHLRAANASRRTLERRFRSETGMSLGRWRRRARILAATGMLAQGDSVTRVAVTIGYASPSSFVSAFRAELGSPPGEFMRT